jgi:hypothetical protein
MYFNAEEVLTIIDEISKNYDLEFIDAQSVFISLFDIGYIA